MIGWMVFLVIAASVAWVLKHFYFVTSLPPGYAITPSSDGYDYAKLDLVKDGELVARSAYVSVYGYRTQIWTMGRIARTHAAMTRAAKPVKPEPFVDPNPFGSPEQEKAYKSWGRVRPVKDTVMDGDTRNRQFRLWRGFKF